MKDIDLIAQAAALDEPEVESPHAAHASASIEAAKLRFQPTIALVSHPQMPIPYRRTRPIMTRAPARVPLPQYGLPPWGKMEERLVPGLDNAVIPIDWTPENWREADDDADGRELNFHDGEWNIWLADIARTIDHLLWPKFNRNDPSRWNTENIVKLFDADFAILAALHQNLDLPILSEHPTQVFHSEFFTEEDDGNVPFGNRYERYDPTLPAHVLRDIPDVLTAGMADKVGTLDLQLKTIFQRPRPHQVAFLQNRGNDDYNYRWAHTANTPSLVAGHCLQGCIAGCTAYAALHSDVRKGPSLIALEQFAVDIGDRRVYAGIHYPSDNLASWYVAMRLVPKVFTSKDRHLELDPAQFLWEAISKRSDVYATIKDFDTRHKDVSPYTDMLDELKKLGQKAREG
jgi:hypothetical protein